MAGWSLIAITVFNIIINIIIVIFIGAKKWYTYGKIMIHKLRTFIKSKKAPKYSDENLHNPKYI